MALYIFEQMTATQAANFTAADTLIFGDADTSATNISVANSGGLNLVTLTDANGTALTFGGDALRGASIAGQIAFSGDASNLLVGTNAGDVGGNALDLGGVDADQVTVAYGFGGSDTIDFSGGTAGSNAFGGLGADSITGGDEGDHLYGFGLVGDGSTDGSDTISGGNGNDYIQGNAGDDTLSGDDGRDRINGGGGADDIDGGNQNDTVNGNKGDDTIDGGAGNDYLQGGQDNDYVFGNTGNDQLLGNLGDDSLEGGAGLDVLTGGDGSDTFLFFNGDASFEAADDESAVYYVTDVITDFSADDDLLDINGVLPASAGEILTQGDGVTFSSVTAAHTYAQQLLTANAGDNDVVVAIQVGADTYLFYDGDGVANDSASAAIKLIGVTADDLTIANFV